MKKQMKALALGTVLAVTALHMTAAEEAALVSVAPLETEEEGQGSISGGD